MRALTVLALTLQLPIGVASIESVAQSLDKDDATLYVLALQDPRLSGRVAPTDPLVVQRQTHRGLVLDLPAGVPLPDYIDPSKRLAYAGADTVARFLRLEERDLPRAIAKTTNSKFIDRKALERWRRKGPGSWLRFQKRYGKEVKLIRLSGIARNDEGSIALMYISYSCNSLCGQSHFVLFKRESGIWRVDRIDLFSVS